MPEPIKPGYPDQVTNALFDYGVSEGIPRALDLVDTHGIEATSCMIAQAIEKRRQLAREIVRLGHEPGAHEQALRNEFDQLYEEAEILAVLSANLESSRISRARYNPTSGKAPRTRRRSFPPKRYFNPYVRWPLLTTIR